VTPGFFEWTSTDRGGHRGGRDYDAGLAEYGGELASKYGSPLEQDELDILRQHDRNDGGIGWNIFKIDIPTAMRMAKKIVPIVEKLEKESPEEANRIKEKLRAEHGLDVNKLMKMYETYGKLFG